MIPPPQAYPYPPPVPSMYVKEQGPPLMQLIPNGKNPKKKSPFQKEQDQEIAGFLLSLKHSRSVSPEPSVASSETTASNYSTGASAFYATGGYATAPPPPHGGAPSAHAYHHHHHYGPPPPPPPHHYQYYPPPPHMHPGFAMSYHPHPSSQQPQGGGPPQASYQEMQNAVQIAPAPPAEPVDLEKLIEESPVVTMKERDLVPDVLFACMAQMDVAQLGQADRVGCYKDRPIGFKGLCCRHCGGQPGFGRFFPNSVRSLAQTTTSQTIVKHVISKCRFTPATVRSSIIELQRQQMARETNGRPRYGSRKIFFQRIWGKLHEGAIGVIDEYYDGSAQSNKEAIEAQLDEPALIAAAAVIAPKEEIPMEDNKKRKGEDVEEDEDAKRFKPLEEAEV